MIDSTLGSRYRVLRLLGEGGMGGVYEAEDTRDARRVAIKVIHPHILRRDAHLLSRFHREGKAAFAITGEHVVRVYESATDEPTGTPYIVMELLDGEDLRSLLKRVKVLPVSPSLRIAAQMCRALVEAHAARVVHRDIKPANILLARRPAKAPAPDAQQAVPHLIVKLLDFGVAKILSSGGDDEPSALTMTNDVVGTPVYMSPEQARGQKAIDFRSDIWSAGMVLYRCLAGRPGYDVTGSLAASIGAMLAGPPLPLRTIAPWVPVEVARVVHRALAMDPADRYQTAADMLAALQALVPGEEPLLASDLVSLDPATPPIAQGGAEDAGDEAAAPTRLAATVRMSKTADNDSPSSSVSAQAFSTLSAPPTAFHRSPAARRWSLVAAVGLAAGAAIALVRMHPAPAPSELAPSSAPAVPSVLVHLAVEPPDAQVEIDGARVDVRDGAIELWSTVGKAYRARVSKDGRESQTTVDVTAQGAVPALLALAPAPPAAPSGSVAPERPGARAPLPRTQNTAVTASPGKPAKVTDPLINGRFE